MLSTQKGYIVKISLIFLYLFLGIAILAQDIAPKESADIDWFVRVTLQNGSVVNGVVLANRFVETTLYGRLYQEIEDISQPNAGIRVWYVRDNPGFIFLPYTEVKRVVKLGRLSSESRERIESAIRAKISQAKQSTEEEQRQKEQKLKKAGIGLTEEEEKEQLAEQEREIDKRAREKLNRNEVLARLSPSARALLMEFPEEEGWSSELYEKLKPRVLRAKARSDYRGISVAYRKFVDSYSEWIVAVEFYKREQENLLGQIKQEIRKDIEAEAKKKKAEALAPAAPTAPAPAGTEPALTELGPTPSDILQSSIQQLLYSKSEKVKLEAIEAISQMGPSASTATQALKSSLKDPSVLVRQAAIRAMSQIREPQDLVLDTLAEALELGDVVVRREAASAFMLFGKAALPKFAILASAATIDEDALVRFRTLRVLEMLGDKRAIGYLQNRLWDNDLAVQVAAVAGLLSFMSNIEELDTWGREILLNGLDHKELSIQILSSESIKKLAQGIDKAETLESLKGKIVGALEQTQAEVKDNLQDTIQIIDSKLKPKPQSPPEPEKPPESTTETEEEDEA